jgi:hypothetical protein
MPKSDLKATVASLAKVAQKTGGVFVFATRDANLPRGENASAEIAEYPFAEHTCNSCDAVFAAVKADGLQTHCVLCGSGKVTASKESSKRSIPADPELSYLQCGACSTHQVFPSAVGAELASKMKCTTCGTAMSYQAKASYELVDDGADTLDIDDMELIDLDGDGDLDGADEPEVVSAEDEPKEDEETAEKTTTLDPQAPAAPLDNGAPSSGQPPEHQGVDTPPNPDAKAPSEATNQDDMPPKAQECTELSMLDTVAADEAVSLAFLNKDVIILAGKKIVATLSPEDAGDNKDLMQTAAFRQSVAHVIGEKGLKEAAAHFGFKSVVVPVPFKAMVDKAVEARVSDKAKQVTAALDSAADQFRQATDIAAAGFAANFWRNKQDPVKAALIKELSSLNIPNPQKVVDRIFESHGVAQLREVIAQARTLAEMPVEALNGLAQAIDVSKYLPTQVVASDDEDKGGDDADEDQDDDSDDSDEESTVTTVARAIDEPESLPVTASVKYKDPQLAQILGNKPLFF